MTAALISTPGFTTTAQRQQATPAQRSISPEIYRRRRLVALALVLGMALGLASFGRQADATPTPEALAAEAVLVVVQPGDTLWTIAQELEPNTDPRELVNELTKIAGGGSLVPGQLLTIPGSVLD